MELPNLKLARHRAGLSQRELAERSGVSRVSLGKLERGQTVARPTTARKLAEALGVNVAALAGQATIGTGGRQGSPVYALVSGSPTGEDAVWARIDGGAEDGADDEEERR